MEMQPSADGRTDDEIHERIRSDIEDATGRPDPEHELADVRCIPLPRHFQELCIYIVPGNRRTGKIIDQIEQNQMDAHHGQER